mgnify:CR=1 FL=1
MLTKFVRTVIQSVAHVQEELGQIVPVAKALCFYTKLNV